MGRGGKGSLQIDVVELQLLQAVLDSVFDVVDILVYFGDDV